MSLAEFTLSVYNHIDPYVPDAMSFLKWIVSPDNLALYNAVLSFGIFCISICRLGKMENVLLRVRSQYVVMIVVSAANGGAPIFFQHWPSGVNVVFTLGVLYMMWSDTYQWRHGAPSAAKTGRGDLRMSNGAEYAGT